MSHLQTPPNLIPHHAITSLLSHTPQANELYKHTVVPSPDSVRKQEMRVDLYATEELNPTYINPRTMTLVETIVLPLDMTRVVNVEHYFIDLTFKFGAVEIEVGLGLGSLGFGCSTGQPVCVMDICPASCPAARGRA
jgi:hypothetical protein